MKTKLLAIYKWIGLPVWVGHFFLSFVAFTKSSVINEGAVTLMWRAIAEVLAYPLIYFANSLGVGGSLVVLMLMNGFLWGVLVMIVAYLFTAFSPSQLTSRM